MKFSAIDSLKASHDNPGSSTPALSDSALADRFSILMAGSDKDSEKRNDKEESRNRKNDEPNQREQDREIASTASVFVQRNPEKPASLVRTENQGAISSHLSPLVDGIVNNMAAFASRPMRRDSEISLSLAERLLPDTQVTLRRSGDTIHVDFTTSQVQSAEFLMGNQAGLAAALGERLRIRANVRINPATGKNKGKEVDKVLHDATIPPWPAISC